MRYEPRDFESRFGRVTGRAVAYVRRYVDLLSGRRGRVITV